MDEILLVRGVRKSFESEGMPVQALRGLDLELASGEFVAVMGPSGCGKSTLLNLVAGVETPSAGEIVLGGASLSGGTRTTGHGCAVCISASCSSSSTCSRG